MSNDASDEETMRLIHEASELIKPGEGEAVFYIRVGGPHTQCTVKAAVGVDPAKVIHAAIDVLNKEFADLKNCPVHTPQPSELVDDDARLILRLAGVRNRLTPSAIERADLDGMAFTIGESQDRIAEMSAQIAKLQADGDKLAGALEKRAFIMSERHLSGARVCIGFETFDDAFAAHMAFEEWFTKWKDRA